MKAGPADPVRIVAARARPSVDLEALTGRPIDDQGQRPLCIPFALAAAHHLERRSDPTFYPAVETLWWYMHQHGHAGMGGALLPHGGDALAAVGHCQETQWPYNHGLGAGTEPPPSAAGLPPWTVAELHMVTVHHDAVEDDIEDALADGHPVVLIVEVTDEFDYPEDDGYVRVPDFRAPTRAYHAVLAVGAWTDLDHGRVLLIRNSWGPAWGADGYALLPPGYLINHGAQAAQVTS